MSNEKPVELTDTERAALMHHIGGWKFERQGLANAEDAFMAEVSRIVAAREAAARREALLEAAEELDAQPSYRVSGLFGHERDYADGKDSEAERIADWLRALAEPERDEEGSR